MAQAEELVRKVGKAAADGNVDFVLTTPATTAEVDALAGEARGVIATL